MAEKVRALENWDRRILAGLVPGLDRLGPWRLLLLPDHATPLRLKTHTSDPVPYLLVDSRVAGPGGTYTEAGVAASPAVPGHELMARLVAPLTRVRPGRGQGPRLTAGTLGACPERRRRGSAGHAGRGGGGRRAARRRGHGGRGGGRGRRGHVDQRW